MNWVSGTFTGTEYVGAQAVFGLDSTASLCNMIVRAPTQFHNSLGFLKDVKHSMEGAL